MITYPTDKLQKVLLSGGCEQRNLPVGFTQVEYLEIETGGVYFSTGINATVDTDMGITASNITSDSAQLLIAQCTSGVDYFRIAKAGASQRVIGSLSSSTVTDNNTDGINKFTARINKSGFYVGDTLVGTFSNVPSSLTGVGEVDIFRGKYSNFIYYAYADSRFHSAWIDDNIFFPCRRNSDNQLGIYNTKTCQFILPSGTGSFTAGPDVTVPTPDTPVDIVCNNGTIKVSPNLFDKNNLPERIDAYFASSGTYWIYTAAGYSLRFPCLPNTTYTARYNGNSEQAVLSFASTNNNDMPTPEAKSITVTQAIRQNNPTINTPITITTGANDKWLIVQYNVADSQNTDMANNLQIELGSTATTYRPYGIYTDGTQEVVTDNLGNTANAEILFAVGDYKDTQSVLDGSVTRNIGIKVLDGTENWVLFNERDNVFTVNIPEATGQSSWGIRGAYVTHFNYWVSETTPTTTSVPYNTIWFNSSKDLRTKFSTDIATTITEFKQFLATQYANGTPVIVVYPLTTPTTEQVTPQPLAGNSVTQTAGSIDNLPINADIHTNMKHRFITDTNGKSRLVNKVYVGSNLVFEENYLVDMGLPSGTLWASRNIDITQPDGFATSPYQYECSFFSWGNVDGHNPSSVSAFAYNWGGVNEQEPYYANQPYGSTPGNTLTGNIAVGEDFDAARANLGAPWRMPTNAEYGELFANIKYINADGTEVDTTKTDKRVNVNGVMGLYLESTINGARLFFSCSGLGDGRSWYGRGSYGYYWSSAWYSARIARGLFFISGGVFPENGSGRYSGFALRPVI